MAATKIFRRFRELLDVTWSSIADGQILQRVGDSIVGSSAPAPGLDWVEEDFTATSGQVLFPLSFTVVGTPIVAIGGLIQPLSEFSVTNSGTSVTLATGVSDGDAVAIVYNRAAAPGGGGGGLVDGAPIKDASHVLSIDPDARKLYASDGTTVAIDWSNGIKAPSVIHNGVTIANLPASPTAGQVASITDGDAALALGATAVNSGAGATKYLVWYNGTNWTVTGK